MDETTVEELQQLTGEVEVDLENQTITTPDKKISFQIDANPITIQDSASSRKVILLSQAIFVIRELSSNKETLK